MTYQDLLKRLEFDPQETDPASVEIAFLDSIKQILQEIQDEPAAPDISQKCERLTDDLQAYFDFAEDWLNRTRTSIPAYIRNKEPDEARALKEKGIDIRKKLQGNLKHFLLCYFYVSLFSALVREQIGSINRTRLTGGKPMKWTSDAGILLSRHRRTSKKMAREVSALQNALAAFEGCGVNFETVESDTRGLFLKAEADRKLSSLRSFLRRGEFDRARNLLTESVAPVKKMSYDQAAAKQMQAQTERWIGTLDSHFEDVKDPDGKVFLKPQEIRMAIQNRAREWDQASSFIVKYGLPYLDSKRSRLHFLKDKLLVTGSLESLIALYNRLVYGLVQPMTELREIREFETKVLQNATYLLDTRFNELPGILKEAKTILLQCQSFFLEYHNEMKRLREAQKKNPDA